MELNTENLIKSSTYGNYFIKNKSIIAKIIPAKAVRIPFWKRTEPLLNIHKDEIAINSIIMPKDKVNQCNVFLLAVLCNPVSLFRGKTNSLTSGLPRRLLYYMNHSENK